MAGVVEVRGVRLEKFGNRWAHKLRVKTGGEGGPYLFLGSLLSLVASAPSLPKFPIDSSSSSQSAAPHLLSQNPTRSRPSSRRPMDGGGGFMGPPPAPRSPEDVFRDYRARRAGLLKALTTDVEKFYVMCDPEKENLCLYGLPNETWEVNLPAEEVPPELPEPALGINFARDGMNEKDWLSLVAVHSDSWLLAVAYYFGARFAFDKESRKRLFTMINNLPTVYEVVTGTAKKEPKEKTPKNSNKSNKSGSKPSRQSEPNPRVPKMPPPKDEEESEGEEGEPQEDHESALCGACGQSYDDFWICCDLCEKWFHGKCVKITPAKAEHIKQYKCPSCTGSKRAKA
ncbi:PHD finger protein ALFIN-LIKE 8 [Dichanthelium oligosanthes]|uniref:PHD finger protein ALFIN-LIKE n=1 Tax=Dichanthelium oligosanthes TaxID=888268 RepID=A0A1E5WKH2_9POAL|nr:PHD finger protein ALFIN-LIKE 8 [Dichanthelium oligosanthes]